MSKTTALLPNQLQAIGHVAAQWAILEATVHWAFQELLSLPADRGRLIAAHIRHADTLLSIIEERTDIRTKLRSRWDDLRKSIKCLNACRDDLVHRRWWIAMSDPETMEGMRDTHVSTLRRNLPPIEITADKIENVAVQISQVRLALLMIVVQIRGRNVSPFP